VDWPPVALFLAVAYAGAWLVTLPAWLAPRHLDEPWAVVIPPAMMFTPALGVLLAVGLIRRGPRSARELGLTFGPSFRRCLPYLLFGWLAMPAMTLAAPFVGVLFGLYHPDLVHLSGFRDDLTAGGGPAPPLSVGLLAVIELAAIPIGALVPQGILAFGEELGWRGYLLPRLLPLGQWAALLLSGVAWGLWHAPIILLGYKYPSHPRLGVLAMLGTAIIGGVLFGWLRLSTNSIWPSVLGHGAVNAASGTILLFRLAGTHPDAALVGIDGVTGWLIPLAVIALLVALHRLPVTIPTTTRPQRRATSQ
jgi:membrane protease YdiL (CAAX protease family)